LHFVFAIILISYAFWFALQLSVPVSQRISIPKIKNRVLAILGVLFFQLIYGALMAGHKAATAAPTWPDINGNFIPPTIFNETPVSLNFVENMQTIHFVHRMLAYVLLVMIIELMIKIARSAIATPYLKKAAIFPVIFVIVQAVLGIISVIISPGIIPGKWGAFEWIAQLHQITGMLLVLSLIATWYLTTGKSFKHSL
jgi:heme a synthase